MFIDAMAFQPATFYTVAHELRVNATMDGGHLRTLISRAYYGALIVARDAKNLSTKGESGHLAVISAYAGSASDEIIADALKTLRGLRVKADYQPEWNLSRGDGDMALANCKKILKQLKALPTNPKT